MIFPLTTKLQNESHFRKSVNLGQKSKVKRLTIKRLPGTIYTKNASSLPLQETFPTEGFQMYGLLRRNPSLSFEPLYPRHLLPEDSRAQFPENVLHTFQTRITASAFTQ